MAEKESAPVGKRGPAPRVEERHPLLVWKPIGQDSFVGNRADVPFITVQSLGGGRFRVRPVFPLPRGQQLANDVHTGTPTSAKAAAENLFRDWLRRVDLAEGGQLKTLVPLRVHDKS